MARLCTTLLLLLAPVLSAYSQLSKSVYKTALLNDTMVATGNRDFLYNTINITNLTADKISILLNITPPEGWEMTTQKVISVSLDGNGNTSIPIRLYPSKSKTALWQTVKIEYRLNDGLEKLIDTFRVRLKEFTKFKAYLPASNKVMQTYEKNIKFPVFLKNLGNTPNIYHVSFSNDFLELNYKETFKLEPGDDTTYNIPLRLSEKQWSSLRKEEIKVQVSVEGGETMNLLQLLSKLGNSLKDHSSAYIDMPLQVEMGSTYQGDDNIQYYGALHGGIDLSPQDRVAFDLRSKTLSKGQSVDNSIVRFEYQGAKWNFNAGNINELTDFYMDGYGAKIGRTWLQQRDKVDLFGLLSSRTGNSKLGGLNYQYGGIRDNIKIMGGFTANFDIDRQLNSYLLKQGGEWKIGDKGKLNVNGGAGIEQSTAKLVSGISNTQYGGSIGYTFQWLSKWLGANSTLLINGNAYPGIFKGQRLQTHDVRFIYKAVYAGGFYETNLRKQNIYQDTTLFSDVFNLKTQNYGARIGGGFRGTNIILSAGNQMQVQSDTGQFAQYSFKYLNLNLSALFFKRLSINVNSYYGQGSIPGQEDTTAVMVNSNQGSIQYRWIGVTARYDNGPYYYHEFVSYTKFKEKYERLLLGPYLDVSMFHHNLNIRSQLNYAKTIPGGIETSSLLTNLAYMNPRYGFDFNIIGLVPIQSLESTPYITASLRVRLSAPFVAVRKYYSLKLVLFKDANNNALMDDGEEPIAGQVLSIKGNLFVTDDKGVALFRNVAKDDYKTDFGFASKIKGWVPSSGPVQSFEIKGNHTYYVPYKKSKILQGKLNLIIDSNSNLSFKLGNIKVSATLTQNADTFNYSTLTDENGEFYFNLPGGEYLITLSPLAFDDNFKPTAFSQTADLMNNDTQNLVFVIKQRKRTINIKKKD
ncbi:MAG: carboxypeptidase regulatory-like domain-containing protein [Bacteroidetes bacterium]|nr:carboxypeptidase regulatory-like domain-containing protein [Bacteroidota bacterium]